MSIEIGSVSGSKDITDYALMERMRKVEEEHKKKEKEREKKEKIDDIEANAKAFRCAHWFCHPRCGFKCKREDLGAIQQHQAQCDWQIEYHEKRKKEQEARVDGNCMMRGVLHSIENAKVEIQIQKMKIKREEKEKLQNWDTVIRMTEDEIRRLENTIKRKQVGKHRLLKYENEILREAAQELYDKYLGMNDSARRRCQY